MKKAKQKTKKKPTAKPKKAAARKTKAKKAAAKKAKVEKPIGAVTHFYGGIKVAIVKFKRPVKSGANLRIRGATTDFAFAASSLEYDHKPVKIAAKGKQIGVKVPKRVREGDGVYLSG